MLIQNQTPQFSTFGSTGYYYILEGTAYGKNQHENEDSIVSSEQKITLPETCNFMQVFLYDFNTDGEFFGNYSNRWTVTTNTPINVGKSSELFFLDNQDEKFYDWSYTATYSYNILAADRNHFTSLHISLS